MYKKFVIKLIKYMPINKTLDFTGLTDYQTTRIFDNYCFEKDKQLDLSNVKTIALDETSIGKGHKFTTNVSDHKSGKLIFLTPQNTNMTVGLFKLYLKQYLGKVKNIKYATADMFGGYRLGLRRFFPKCKLTMDRFHVMLNVNKAFDEVRRNEKLLNKNTKKLRFILLKRSDRLTKEEKAKIEPLLNDSSLSCKAYQLKVSFEDFYKCKDKDQARKFFKS
jgi:transposase